MRNPWTPREIERLLAMREQGLTYEIIAQRLGRTVNSVIGRAHICRLAEQGKVRPRQAPAFKRVPAPPPSLEHARGEVRTAIARLATKTDLKRLSLIVNDELGAVIRTNVGRANAEGWIV